MIHEIVKKEIDVEKFLRQLETAKNIAGMIDKTEIPYFKVMIEITPDSLVSWERVDFIEEDSHVYDLPYSVEIQYYGCTISAPKEYEKEFSIIVNVDNEIEFTGETENKLEEILRIARLYSVKYPTETDRFPVMEARVKMCEYLLSKNVYQAIPNF